jgi:hypothetical protein
MVAGPEEGVYFADFNVTAIREYRLTAAAGDAFRRPMSTFYIPHDDVMITRHRHCFRYWLSAVVVHSGKRAVVHGSERVRKTTDVVEAIILYLSLLAIVNTTAQIKNEHKDIYTSFLCLIQFSFSATFPAKFEVS